MRVDSTQQEVAGRTMISFMKLVESSSGGSIIITKTPEGSWGFLYQEGVLVRIPDDAEVKTTAQRVTTETKK